MTRIDKMLHEARLLDARTRECIALFFIEKTIAGKWIVHGSNKQFDTVDQAKDFCMEQTASNPLVINNRALDPAIIINDIPRVPYEGDYIDTCTKTEAEAMKELMEHGYKGTS